jgi:putative ABC transport system ATP-binding protein
MIELVHVSKIYRMGEQQVAALRDVSLAIAKGEYVAIMGPSGSGKSTLMHLIGCLDRPTTGSYHFLEREVAGLDDEALAELRNKRIGFVFQSFFLLPRYTARKNVELPMLYAGVPSAERQQRADAALEAVGLLPRKDHRPSEMSGGEQQRVAIARALVNQPVVVLADEPTGNLDSRSGDEVLRIFDRLNAEGVTILLVTHEQEVAAHARRAILLKDGIIVKDEATRIV